MEKLISFDLEIAKELPDSCPDWKAEMPLGITCAAFKSADFADEEFSEWPQMTQKHTSMMVEFMLNWHQKGYKFLTWNGTSFDFHVLAQESGRWEDCANLCMDHVDMMLIATMAKGWYVSLDSALWAHHIPAKIHRVKLKDGSWIQDMDGSKAPGLWKAGETEAVLTYLRGDVDRTLRLAQDIVERKRLEFISHNFHVVQVPKLYTVSEAMQMEMADNSWMSDPAARPTKEKFVEWMIPFSDEAIDKKPC